MKVGEERESQVGKLDKLKLKTIVLHGYRDEEVHMTQSVGFVAAELISIDLVFQSFFE